MELGTKTWILAGHLIGVILWVASMTATYWLLRIHEHAPKDARDRLTAMERSLALTMDIAATLAIGCGIALIINPVEFQTNIFAVKPTQGWFHAKLAAVVLGILPIHGLIRAKVKKFSNGQTPTVPQWAWSLLLAAICAIVILVIKRPF